MFGLLDIVATNEADLARPPQELKMRPPHFGLPGYSRPSVAPDDIFLLFRDYQNIGTFTETCQECGLSQV
jgi:hypothetical protein